MSDERLRALERAAKGDPSLEARLNAERQRAGLPVPCTRGEVFGPQETRDQARDRVRSMLASPESAGLRAGILERGYGDVTARPLAPGPSFRRQDMPVLVAHQFTVRAERWACGTCGRRDLVAFHVEGDPPPTAPAHRCA